MNLLALQIHCLYCIVLYCFVRLLYFIRVSYHSIQLLQHSDTLLVTTAAPTRLGSLGNRACLDSQCPLVPPVPPVPLVPDITPCGTSPSGRVPANPSV